MKISPRAKAITRFVLITTPAIGLSLISVKLAVTEKRDSQPPTTTVPAAAKPDSTRAEPGLSQVRLPLKLKSIIRVKPGEARPPLDVLFPVPPGFKRSAKIVHVYDSDHGGPT